MTDSGPASDFASLEPLEPLEPAAAAAAEAPGDPLQAQRAGLPAPALNLHCRDQTFYRFLFAGVVMLVGTLLPYGPEPHRILAQTMSGALYLLLAIAMIWTWWGAIANNRSSNASVKWLLLCMIPLIGGIWNMAAFNAEAALTVAVNRGWLSADASASQTWSGMLGDAWKGLAKRDSEAQQRVEMFWRLFGPGNLLVTLGALLAELGFVGGVFAGLQQNKQEQKQRQMAAAERRRR